jgi:DtxR family Mn-dependent transcriptional regulator
MTTPATRLPANPADQDQLREIYLSGGEETRVRMGRLSEILSCPPASVIADLLSNPTADPHGEPIPGADLQAVADESYALAEAEIGARLRVVRVHDRNPALLKYLAEIGLVPGARVRVLEHLPFEGPLVISLGGKSMPVGLPVAEAVFVNSGPG